MKWDAYYVSILSEKYRNNRLGWLFGIYYGFLSNWKARRSQEYSSLVFVIKNKKTWF